MRSTQIDAFGTTAIVLARVMPLVEVECRRFSGWGIGPRGKTEVGSRLWRLEHPRVELVWQIDKANVDHPAKMWD